MKPEDITAHCNCANQPSGKRFRGGLRCKAHDIQVAGISIQNVRGCCLNVQIFEWHPAPLLAYQVRYKVSEIRYGQRCRVSMTQYLAFSDVKTAGSKSLVTKLNCVVVTAGEAAREDRRQVKRLTAVQCMNRT